MPQILNADGELELDLSHPTPFRVEKEGTIAGGSPHTMGATISGKHQSIRDKEKVGFYWSEKYQFEVDSALPDVGPKFGDTDYIKAVEEFLSDVRQQAAQVLIDFGLNKEDREITPIKLKANDENLLPAGVYVAARVIELIESMGSIRNRVLHVSDLHVFGMIVQYTFGTDIEILERELGSLKPELEKAERRDRHYQRTGESTKKTYQTRNNPRNEEMRKIAGDIWDKNPSRKLGEVADEVGRRMGLSVGNRTIQDQIRPVRPK